RSCATRCAATSPTVPRRPPRDTERARPPCAPAALMIRAASRMTGARERADVASFYHLRGASFDDRTCAGTACFVARFLDPDRWRAADRAPRVYCLGKCYAAPAAAADSRRPAVAVASPRPVVLERVADGGARTLAEYTALGGYRALDRAPGTAPAAVVAAVGRGRGLPDRAEARRRRRPARGPEVRRDERRRGRSRRVRRPDPAGGRPARAPRRPRDRGIRRRGDEGMDLPPPGVPRRAPDPRARDRGRARGGHPRPEAARPRARLRRRGGRRPRELRVRGGDRAPRVDRGPASLRAAASAVSERARAPRPADARAERRDARERALDRRARQRGVRRDGVLAQPRHEGR